ALLFSPPMRLRAKRASLCSLPMGSGPRGSTATLSGQTHTFLFTDVEGSTRRWRSDAEEMAAALARDGRGLRRGREAQGGAVFKSVGDGICAVFPSVVEAVRAAVDAQCELTLPVRVAVHTGEAVERDGDFFGVTLSHCARLLEAGHGGQVLVSASAVSVAGDGWGPNIGLRD